MNEPKILFSTSKTYKLQVKETGNKAGKFHYQVIDEAGNVLSERRSNREYVACTANGSHYFGRLDLIGKGDHGSLIKFWSNAPDSVRRDNQLYRLRSIAFI